MVNERAERLDAADVAGFTVAVALSAIFVDAALGHGLTWENDPYWTYWVTKTFLIATIFGLGTALFGVGAGRGAVITVVHTVVLTVYYWSLSPVGLPSHPTWLDLEHTWVTGVPIHFAVIYLGYLLALWGWRRRVVLRAASPIDPGPLAVRALVVGIAVVVIAGGLSSLALGEFPGFTWFLVRLLLTVTFLLVWWALVGTDVEAGLVGATVLAFGWATYSQFVGPVGLPDTPLRILDPAPPPAVVRWLDYRELWLISLPIYLVVMAIALTIGGRAGAAVRRRRRGAMAAAALVPVVLLTTGLTIEPQDRGVSASFSATDEVNVGDVTGTGDISITAVDMGNRVTPLPPHDELMIEATFEAEGRSVDVQVDRVLVDDPLGEETTWWGVAFDVDYREGAVGDSYRAELVAYGLGSVSIDGDEVASGVPVEVIASDEYGLVLEIGTEAMPVPGQAEPVIEATWPSFSGEAPSGPYTARYIGGGVVLVLLLLLALLLERRSPARRTRVVTP